MVTVYSHETKRENPDFTNTTHNWKLCKRNNSIPSRILPVKFRLPHKDRKIRKVVFELFKLKKIEIS